MRLIGALRGALARCCAAACLALPALALAAPHAEDLYRESLAAGCAACHGTRGRALPDVAWKGLAGMPAQLLVERMRQFRAGTRESTVMQQLARGYSDAQIRALAAYFAAQTPP